MGVVVADEDVEDHRTGQHIDGRRRAGDVPTQERVAFLEARTAAGLVFVGRDVAQRLTEILLMDALAVAAVVTLDQQEIPGLMLQNGSSGDGESCSLR